jgi:hypothetical protein
VSPSTWLVFIQILRKIINHQPQMTQYVMMFQVGKCEKMMLKVTIIEKTVHEFTIDIERIAVEIKGFQTIPSSM